MLILNRKRNQRIVLTAPDGQRIYVELTDVRGKKAAIGVEAPREYRVDREEVALRREMEVA